MDSCRGIINKIGYSYNDLKIVPAVTTDIVSRKECDIFEKDGFLPIFASPMLSVTNNKNFRLLENNKIHTITPRSIPFQERLFDLALCVWTALSLKEFEKIFVVGTPRFMPLKGETYRVCVDLANGHMHSIYSKIYDAKEKAKREGYNLVVMTGNIANPETYRWLCDWHDEVNMRVVDYIRLSIGSGSGCFVDGTKIKTNNGEKNIEDIELGDNVLTIDGTYKRVDATIRYKEKKNLIKINNEITCTGNHKFFVIDKDKANYVSNENYETLGHWVEAKDLNKDKHLLLKLE